MSAIKSSTPEREWTTREQLILASAVQKSGDQNWVSVSRAMKPVLEVESVSGDVFSHKNCALQYSSMLDKAGTHKRRRSAEAHIEAETAGQHIVRELVDQYLMELDQALAQSREEYQALKKEMEQIERGELDSQLPSMWEGIQAELAMSKTSPSSRRKSSPSKSSLNKQLDQMKQQRKKASPVSSPGSSLTRSLSSSGISSSTKKTVVLAADGSVGDGRGVVATADDDKGTSQVAALLGYGGGSPVGSVGSSDGSEQLLSLVVGGDRIQSPRTSLQSGGMHEQRTLISPGALAAGNVISPGTLTAGGMVFPAAGGGVIMPGISQEQVGVASESLPLGVKVKAEPVSTPSPTPPVMLLPPPASKPSTPQLSFTKLPIDVRAIKREPSSASPTTVDTPSPRVLTTPIKDEKTHVPMQTPPSTHVVQMPAEVHVIIQQPNIAALPLVQDISTPQVVMTGSQPVPATCAPAMPLLTVSSSGLTAAMASPANAAAGAGLTIPISSTLTGMLSSSTKPAPSLSSPRPLPGITSGVNTGIKGTASGAVGSSAGLLQTVLSGMGSIASGGISATTSLDPGSSLSASLTSGTRPALSTGSVILTAGGSTSPLVSNSYPVLSSVVGGAISASSAAASFIHPLPPTPGAVAGPVGATSSSLLVSSSLDKATSSLSLSLASGSARTSGSTRLAGPNLSSGSVTLIASSHSLTLSPVISSTVSVGGARVGIPVKPVEGSAMGSVVAGSSATNIIASALHPTTTTKSIPTRTMASSSASMAGILSVAGLSPATATMPSIVSKVPPVGVVQSSGVSVVATSSVLRHTPSTIGGAHVGPVKTFLPSISKELKALSAGMALTSGVPTLRSPDQVKLSVTTTGTIQATPTSSKTPFTVVKTSPVTGKTSPSVKTPPITSTQQARTLPPITVTPQSARQATPSSSSPASLVKSSPDAVKSATSHPLPAHHMSTATKYSFLPSLSLSSSLVSIGGAPKTLPTSVLPQGATQPQGTQPQTSKPQRVTMVHLEKKAIPSKQQQSSKSALPDTSAAGIPPSTKTFSVANTSAVAAHRATISTSSKPKSSTATSSPSSSNPLSSSTSTSSNTLSRSPVTTVVSSSLSIPILSPSKNLLTGARQSLSPTVRTSSSASSTVVSGTVSEPQVKDVPGSKRLQAHSEQKELATVHSGVKRARDSQTPPTSVLTSVNKATVSTPARSTADASSKVITHESEASATLGISDKQSSRRLSDEKGADVDSKIASSVGGGEDYTSPLVTTKATTPVGSMEQETSASCDLDSSLQSKADSTRSQDEMDTLDDEAPLKTSMSKQSKSSVKKQWNTRSRKLRTPQHQQHHHQRSFSQEEGYSVESTDTEDDSLSHPSAVPSPVPSQGEDSDSVLAHRQWKKAIIIVWRHAAQHKYANLFLHPVRDEDAPGYSNVILRPMDLSTIKKKIDSGLIKTDIEFQRDMLLMFQNAFMYNNSQHEVYFMAQEMRNDVMENIQEYLATQAQLQLMEEATPSKILRSREGRFKESYEEHMSPAKKRRTRADDI